MGDFKVGDQVEVTGKDLRGQIAFIGSTEFAQGKWIGVVLPDTKGKNNGTVQGKSYFDCKANHGIFVRQNQVTLVKSASKPPPGKATPSKLSSKKTDEGEVESGLPPRTSGTSSHRLSGIKPPTRLSLAGGTAKTGLKVPGMSKSSIRGSTEDLIKSASGVSKSPSSISTASSTDETPSRGLSTPSVSVVAVESEKKLQKEVQSKSDEITDLQRTVKDFEEKVVFLTAKRAEDKGKIKEMEKFKVQISQFTDYKAQWTAAQAELHEQLKTAKKEAKENSESKGSAENELEELRDRVEEMALDKEMAEEMKEVAELEVEKITDQYKETKQELDLMKEEINSGTGGGNVDNVRIKQLELQTNQLKDAVIKLKDLNSQDRKEVESLTEKLTTEQATVEHLSKLKDSLESELEEHESMVSELTEQVECCIGAENMVEKLTDSNLELEEKMVTMASELSDLEALRDCYEELEEERMATERELREELEISRNTHFQHTKKIEEQGEQNNDLQGVVMQFRSYVNQLQAQLKETQAQLSQDREESEGMGDEKIHQFAQMRAQLLEQSKTVSSPASYDVDFAEIDISESKEEVRLLKLFFPEKFSSPGSDYEAIKLILQLTKLAVSSEVIGRVSSKHLKLSDLLSGAPLTPLQCDKAVYAAGLALDLANFRVVVTNFERCIKQCDPDIFLRLGRLSSDLGPHTAMLSVFRMHLEKGSLDESVDVEPVRQSAAQFQALSNTHFPDLKPSCREVLSDDLMIMQFTSEGLIASCDKLIASLSRVQEGSMLLERVGEIKGTCSEFLKTMRRIKNFVPAQGKPFSFPADVDEVLTASKTGLGAAFTALTDTAYSLSMHVAGVAEDDVITVPDIEDIIKKGCSTVGSTGVGIDRVKEFIASILPPLQTMAKNIQDGDYDQLGDAATKFEPPYDARAKLFKEQFSLGDQLKDQLEFKTNENYELKKMVKIKGEEVSQQAVKADMLEKRLDNARRDGEAKTDALKQELTDAKKTITEKDRQFEETMDHLQEDINSLETEKSTLKMKLEQANKRAPRAHLTESILAEQAAGPPGSVRVIVEDSPATLNKLESLQHYAQLVQEENVKLMAEKLKAKLANLPPLIFKTSTPPVIECEKPVNELQQQLLNLIANTKVVDITKRTNGKIPADVLAEQKATRACLHNQYTKVKLQAQKEMGRYYGAGGFIETSSGDFITPEFARVVKEKESCRMFGKIKIPSGAKAGVYKLLLDSQEIGRLNSTLLVT